MIVSRVLPTLIRLNHVIYHSTFTKTLINSSSQSLKILFPAGKTSSKFQIKTMATDIDKELNDPKRHFDYDQLIEKKKQENVVIIDVREHSEINETGKIPGSIHIPLNELKKALGEIPNEGFLNLYTSQKPKIDDEIIFTCRSGRRSLTAMKTAFELGYLKAGNYKGGWLDWAEKTGKSQ